MLAYQLSIGHDITAAGKISRPATSAMLKILISPRITDRARQFGVLQLSATRFRMTTRHWGTARAGGLDRPLYHPQEILVVVPVTFLPLPADALARSVEPA